MKLTGCEIYAKNGSRFEEYRIEWHGASGDGLTVALHACPVSPGEKAIDVSVPRSLFQPLDMGEEDYVRIAVVTLRDSNVDPAGRKAYFAQPDDVERSKNWLMARPQTTVLHDVLALLCEATVGGLCTAEHPFRVISVLTSVRGTREQIMDAIAFLIESDDLGREPLRGTVDAHTALHVKDFWLAVRRAGQLNALSSHG